MQCPKCQSQEVYLCSVAFAAGTTTTKTEGRATTNSYAAADMNLRTTSTSRTEFAQRCAPPTSTLWWAILATFVFFVIDLALLALMSADHKALGTGTYVMLGILAACVLWLIGAIRNRPQYRKALARWHKAWVCARCGNFFVPDPQS